MGTDTRSRHVEVICEDCGSWCLDCNKVWPCDAIRESDRADLAESMLAMCRADLGKAESDHVQAVTDWRGAVARADKAEAALDECRTLYAKAGDDAWMRCIERDDALAARKESHPMTKRNRVDALTDAIVQLARDDPGAFSAVHTYALAAPLAQDGQNLLRLAAQAMAQRLDRNLSDATLGRGRVTDRRLDQRLKRAALAAHEETEANRG
jgi:hypothetical protein